MNPADVLQVTRKEESRSGKIGDEENKITLTALFHVGNGDPGARDIQVSAGQSLECHVPLWHRLKFRQFRWK